LLKAVIFDLDGTLTRFNLDIKAVKERIGGGGSEKQKSKMRSCAKKWKSSGRSGSYRSFMSKCLRG